MIFKRSLLTQTMIQWLVRKDLSNSAGLHFASLPWTLIPFMLEFALSFFNCHILGRQGHPFSQ